MAEINCRRSPHDHEAGFRFYEVHLHVVLLGGGANALNGVRDEQDDGNRLARGGTFTLDARKVEEVFDDSIDPERLVIDSLG